MRKNFSMSWNQIGLLTGMVICWALAVFSDSIVELLPNFSFVDSGTLENIFTGLMAILASVLGLAQGALRTRLTLSNVEGLDTSLPGIDDTQVTRSSQPLEKIILLENFPTFKNEDSIRDFVYTACILANFLPIKTERIRDLDSLFKDPAVMALIADESFFEDISPYLAKRKTVFIGIRPGDKHSVSNFGSHLRVTVSNSENSIERLSLLAKVLTPYHGLDTPRGVGFHGNWLGTYGLMVLKQNDNLTVSGVYWYGRGKLTGHCQIDSANHRLLLHFQWNQASDNSGVGSGNKGHGVFAIPAGHNFLYGYWCPNKDQDMSQGWSAARVSGDITANILDNGEFAKDCGLSQHPRTEIIEW